jgi:hypothetical protein
MQKLMLKRRKADIGKKDDGRTEIDKVEYKQLSICRVCKEIADLLYLAVVFFVIALILEVLGEYVVPTYRWKSPNG